MTGFKTKNLDSIKTLGEILRKHRLAKKLTPEQAGKEININNRYIRLLEKNGFDDLPADVYTTNILKNYAELLELNPYTVIELYKKEKTVHQKTIKKNKELIQESKILSFLLNPKFIKYVVFIFVVVAILSYLGWGVNKIITPPHLEITTPNDNLSTTTHSITVAGHTDREVELFINNRPILIDTNGEFSVDLDLQKGLNVVKITAQKKHSKKNIIYRKIIVNHQE